jgi:hypothetical protein
VPFNPAAGFPGDCVTGPFAETAILAGLLLNDGIHRGQRILRPETAAALTARHRASLIDERHGVRLDWGLGLATAIYLDLGLVPPDAAGRDHAAPLVGVV